MEREKERKREGNVLAIYPDQESDPVSLGSPFQSVPGRRWVQRPYRSLSLLSSAFHAAPSPPPSWTVYLPPAERTLLPSAITPARPSTVLVPQTTLSPRYSELSACLSFPRFVADYFGRVERIHYASVQFADFWDRRAEGGGPESASGGWKFEKEESGDRVGRREKGRWIGVTGYVGATG